MITRIVVTGAAICALVIAGLAPADARARHRHSRTSEDPVVALLKRQAVQIEQMRIELAAIHRQLRPDAPPPADPGDASARSSAPPNPFLDAGAMPIPHMGSVGGYAAHIAQSTKLSDLAPGLAAKVVEILHSCRTKVTSGYRRGARVAGSGRPSLHSTYPSQAADLVGDPACIYAHLKKWPGGYSVDYAAVRHVHVSLSAGSRERGARFVHYRGGYTRHARVRTPRYARYRETYQVRYADATHYRPHRVQ